MCGITAYLGAKKAAEILLAGLARLEYRGYDSAGVAICNDGALNIQKKVGKVKELHAVASSMQGTTGIGHTRWATHGEPSERNAHPHVPTSQNASDAPFALVHNGIIENFKTLKESLSSKGYKFYSDTDTEVLVKLIESMMKTTGLGLEEAVRQALSQVVGAYGICICSRDDPDVLVAARLGSPLMLGIGEDEWFVASDASAFLEYTRQVVYLNDGEMVVIRRNSGYQVSTVKGHKLYPEVVELEGTLDSIEKGGYRSVHTQQLAAEQCMSAIKADARRAIPRVACASLRLCVVLTLIALVQPFHVERDHGATNFPRKLHARPRQARALRTTVAREGQR
jgi:glucosamine--fructose-6-phosphate aminotransferase (isomerizing)